MVIRTFTSFVGAPSFIVKVGLHVKKSHSFSIQRTKKICRRGISALDSKNLQETDIGISANTNKDEWKVAII